MNIADLVLYNYNNISYTNIIIIILVITIYCLTKLNGSYRNDIKLLKIYIKNKDISIQYYSNHLHHYVIDNNNIKKDLYNSNLLLNKYNVLFDLILARCIFSFKNIIRKIKNGNTNITYNYTLSDEVYHMLLCYMLDYDKSYLNNLLDERAIYTPSRRSNYYIYLLEHELFNLSNVDLYKYMRKTETNLLNVINKKTTLQDCNST
jgi:hypothetical protein